MFAVLDNTIETQQKKFAVLHKTINTQKNAVNERFAAWALNYKIKT